MSTWIYLKCLDHAPPIVAAHESGQHLYDLAALRADVLNRDELIERTDLDIPYANNYAEYFRSHTRNFLVQHPICRLGIEDEYGRDYPIEEPDES